MVPQEWQKKPLVSISKACTKMHWFTLMNGDLAISQNNGYVPFYIEADRFLKYGAENEILVSVHVANGARWYSGAGIYRDVYLCTADSVHIQPNSLRVETVYAPSCSDPQTQNGRDLVEACIRVRTLVKNEGAAQKTVRVHVRLLDAAGCCAAEGTVPLTLRRGECAYSDQKLSVSDPKLWGCDTPYLYTCQATVSEPGAVIVHADGSYERGADRLLDADDVRFGIRTFTLSPQCGLTMNGMPLKLKGAGMHHENGPAGAINGMMNNLADAFASIMQLPVVGDATEEACAYIAVFRPENYGKVPIQSPWAWSDTVGSWSFEGREGKPVQLEVYADAEEVELFLNGKSAGKAIITEKDRYKAAFELLWQPGTIEAVSVSEWHGLWALCAYKRRGRAVAFCRTGMCGGFVSPAGCDLRPDPGSRRKRADFAAEKRHCQRLHRRPRRAAWLRFR